MDINSDHFEPAAGLSQDERGEIHAVLNRIRPGEGPGRWHDLPDQVRVLRRMHGGRGGCEVFEVEVLWGTQRLSHVAKLGPAHQLKDEFQAYFKYLDKKASGLFAPIRAASEGVIDAAQAVPGQREAVVYGHASQFTGTPGVRPETFETVAAQAIRRHDASVDAAVSILTRLFEGIGPNLYACHSREDLDQNLLPAWNLRLGPDLVVEVDRLADKRFLPAGDLSEQDLTRAECYPLNVLESAARHDAQKIRPGMLVHLRNLTAVWWGDQLMAEALEHDLRVEVLAPRGRRIRDLAAGLKEGDLLRVCGRVRSVQARACRERLLAGLPDFGVRKGTLSGPDAEVPDPFDLLPAVLETRRPGRWTALVHGDMNPRNVLVVAGRPCLIDYALTKDGEPLLADFVRLEGTLARDVLPEDLSWAQLVRLERLLAAACRLDDEAAERFAARLAKDRAELGAAFRIFWAIRRAARETYPQEDRDGWWRDYLEQLFLFAHISLKWDNPSPQALRATAAMAGAAAEVLAPHEAFLVHPAEA